MTTLRTAAQQALEFIRSMNSHGWLLADYEGDMERTVAGLEAALAQEQAEPVQEPVAIADGTFNHDCPIGTLLYTAPPKLVPLTDGALMGVYIDFDRTADPAWSGVEYLLRLCRAIERAHGIGDSNG